MKYNKITLLSTFIILKLVARLIRYNMFFLHFEIFLIEFSIELLVDVIFPATKFNDNFKAIHTNPHFTPPEFSEFQMFCFLMYPYQ